MEPPVRLFHRRVLMTKPMAASAATNSLKPFSPLIPYRYTNLRHPFNKTGRIQSSVSPISHSYYSPQQNAISFLLSLSSPHLLNPSIPFKDSSFGFKFHSKDASFSWNRAPESVIEGKVGALGRKEPVVSVVLIGWLGAREKHLKKYVEWYNSRGIHAITFVVKVGEMLRFDLGRRAEKRISELAEEIVNWVSEKEEDGRDRCLMFHTFSNTGWLVYGYLLDMFQSRKDVIEKIRGCVADSGGGELLTPKVWAAGFAAALLKKRSSAAQHVIDVKEKDELDNQDIQSRLQEQRPAIESLVLLILEKLFSAVLQLPEVEEKLKKIIVTLSRDQPSCPYLFMYSTADKVVPFQSIESLIEQQRSAGRRVLSYNFLASPHVDHFRTFPDVYSSVLQRFLTECFAAVQADSRN